jgi:hypothetical protein
MVPTSATVSNFSIIGEMTPAGSWGKLLTRFTGPTNLRVMWNNTIIADIAIPAVNDGLFHSYRLVRGGSDGAITLDVYQDDISIHSSTGIATVIGSFTSKTSIGRSGEYTGLYFKGIISDVEIYDSSGDLAHNYLRKISATTWTDETGSNDGTINGASLVIVPALEDGTADALGNTLKNPAGPWLYEGLGSTYVNFDVVADASFNGTTSYLDTTNNFHWANAFDVAMRITQLGVGSGRLIGSSSNGNYSHRSSGLTTRTKINGTELVTTAVFTSNVEYLTEFSYTGGNDGTITASINGDSSSLVNDAVSVPNNAKLRIGANNTFSAFTELSARGFAANNNGAEWVDMPLLGCSLDLSSNVNHGTDTDVVYNRLTDVSYQAGDTVEQPFSVSTTGNKVYDLVKFTFPVTT